MLTLSQLAAARKVVLEQFEATRAPAAGERAEKCLTNEIISSPTFPDVLYKDDSVWMDRGARSHERYLHGFLFFADWFGTVFLDENRRPLASQTALCIIESWKDSVTQNPPARMAYHDETTAQRLISLLQLEPFLHKGFQEQSISFVRPLMDETAALLGTTEFYSEGNNHGMFQDLALLYYSVLADWQENECRIAYFSLALERLRKYFDLCYTSDGVHVENTPTYHVLVSKYLALVQRIVKITGHADAGHYDQLIEKAEIYATHALMPNGVFPPISDTQQKSLNNKNVLNVFPSQDFLFAATKGKAGTKPANRILLLPASGYAIYRSAWGDPKATYGFFSAAYNADYHKHSDDLSFYLRSNGIDLLSESGPYSYDYKHPFSRYAYSQFSHNSLVVDGKSLPRTDDNAHKVSLKVLKEHRHGFSVEGTNSRYSDTKHTRRLQIDDSSGDPRVFIVDEIDSSTPHDYQLLWNVGTKVRTRTTQDGFELFASTEKVMELAFTASTSTEIAVHRGQKKPSPLGWTFPKFGEAVPSDVVTISFSGKEVTIKTEIRLGGFKYSDAKLSTTLTRQQHQDSLPSENFTLPSKLLVVFASKDTEDLENVYRNLIDTSTVQALYIPDSRDAVTLDDSIGQNIRSNFESIQALIARKMADLNIDNRNVVTLGLSGAGVHAMAHGLRLGASQIYIGASKEALAAAAARYRSAPVSSEKRQNTNANNTKIFVATDSPGASSKLYIEEMLDNHLGRSNVSYVPLSGFSDATDMSPYLSYFRAGIDHWCWDSDEEPLAYSIDSLVDGGEVELKIYSAEPALHAYRLFHGRKLIESRSYSRSKEIKFTSLTPGSYRVRVSSRAIDGTSMGSFTSRRVSVI